MKTLTHSMMQCFMDCRQKYQFRYVDEVVPVTSAAALYFGSAVHRGLESWFKYGIKDAALLAIECQDMPEPEIIKAKALLEKYIEHWSPEQFEVVEDVEMRRRIYRPHPHRQPDCHLRLRHRARDPRAGGRRNLRYPGQTADQIQGRRDR